MADYNANHGLPARRWIGAGSRDLAGQVGKAQIRALFGRGEHPDSAQLVAAALAAGASLLEARREVFTTDYLRRRRDREMVEPGPAKARLHGRWASEVAASPSRWH